LPDAMPITGKPTRMGTNPPSQMLKISSFGLTDRGKVRPNNEDALYLNDEKKIYAVADGLGGLPEGALASSLSVKHFGEIISSEDFNGTLNYQEIFLFLNKIIYREGKKVSADIGIGTTLTVLQIIGNEMSIGHVGDCALFLFRGKEVEQLTIDHTMEQEVKSRMAPDENPIIPEFFAHTLTRCLGQQGALVADVYNHDIVSGDRILLCSDGITKTIDDHSLLEKMKAADTPETYVRGIVDMANQRGGPDNSTAIGIWIA